MSDRPIGCILSGGLDSTTVTAIACKLQKQMNPNAPPMRTYTVGLEGGEDFIWARKAAKHFGTEHHEFVLSEKDFLDAIPHVIRQIESYDVTTVRASTGNWLVAREIAKLGKDIVLFCGDVADELLGGYRGFGLTDDPELFDAENVKMMQNLHRFDVLRAEKSFAGFGLEGRVPFADKEFMKLIMNAPPEYKMWGCNTGKIEKDCLRRAFEAYLPKDLCWRRKEAFSDGVSKKERSWFQIIQDDLKSSGKEIGVRAHCSPYDLESTLYREIFESFYSSDKVIPYLWK